MKTVRARQTQATELVNDGILPVIGWGVMLACCGVTGVLMAHSYIVGA